MGGRGHKMAEYMDREAYIPFTRADTVALCADEGRLAPAAAAAFRRFCEILIAYKHHESLRTLERLKRCYAPLNPDAVTIPAQAATPEERSANSAELRQTLEEVLREANFRPITEAEIRDAFGRHALIKLRTRVAMDAFEEVLLYARGRRKASAVIREWWLWKRKITFDDFDRVAVLLKLREDAGAESDGNGKNGKRRKKGNNPNFAPGKMYLYLYRDIPKYDMEVLFPNLETRMNARDMLFFGVPAAAVAVSVLMKAIPKILLLFGLIMLLLYGPDIGHRYGIDETTKADLLTLWAALSSIVIGLGGFAFRQWSSYRTKQIQFQKLITETLFFKNLANNAGVFHLLLDEAEEEQCKEMALVYYHLLTSPEPLNKAQLDNRIEEWFDRRFGVKLDFDVAATVRYLSAIRGCPRGAAHEAALLDIDADGRCVPLPLDTANALIDTLWDKMFPYAGN